MSEITIWRATLPVITGRTLRADITALAMPSTTTMTIWPPRTPGSARNAGGITGSRERGVHDGSSIRLYAGLVCWRSRLGPGHRFQFEQRLFAQLEGNGRSGHASREDLLRALLPQACSSGVEHPGSGCRRSGTLR